MRRPFPLLAAVVLAAVLAACSRSEPQPEPLRAVRTERVGMAAVSDAATYAAEVRARTESRLSLRVGGKLLRRTVDLGDRVRPGQLLAELDPGDLKLAQAAAQAAARAAQVQLSQARADLERARELAAQQFVGPAELQRRQTAVEAAQAALEQARAQEAAQGNQAGYSRLLADAAGVITAVEAEPGAVLAAGAPLLRLAQDGPRDVVFSVPEDRVEVLRTLRGRPGALQVRPWAAPAQAPALAARVREVAAAADPLTRTYLVKAELQGGTLQLGQTATVTLSLPGPSGQIRLPPSALWEQGGRSMVWLLDAQAMTVTRQPVQISGALGRDLLVGAGLQPGQEVVTAGVHVLTEGQKVRRWIEPRAAAAASAASSSAAVR
ncbi:MAG: efflux RND transporter periplasmic adaptor subunit [Burkholderiaceae bacterium]|nr:efflux RND transporter periplasmic adaptor subunit [Burkholderiaceae bacterium]